jgi:phosphoribosyl 1,2-cyclic phosphodiesterase
MKLTFLGTRGYIDPRTEEHGMHSTCRVTYRGKDILIDCGEDWLGRHDELQPRALFVTHAHPDHAGGLKDGADFPVYATRETWEVLGDLDMREAHTVEPREPLEVRGINMEAFPLLHSTRAPAVGYRINAGRVAVFYVPDVAYIEDRADALAGIKAYVGDGASIRQPLIRKPGDTIIGHAAVQTQLTWCAKEGVPRALFTHCGSEITETKRDEAEAIVASLGRDRGVRAEIAKDGMAVVLR